MTEFAEKICSMIKNYSSVEVLQYFENNKGLISRKNGEIKAIGIYYHRMFDGGIERVISNLIPMWIDMGYRVVLFTEENPNPRDYYYPEEVHRIIIPVSKNLEGRLCAMESGIIEEQIDVFVHNGWESETVLWEMLVVKSLGVPFILYSHGHFSSIYTLASDYSMISGRVFSLCDKIITLCDVNAQFYELYGCEVARIENPIPKEIRAVQPVYSNKDNHHVLWIGRIAKGKRFHDALKIVAEVKKRITDIELDVVGTGNEIEIENAKRICDDLGLSDSVHFHGYHLDVGRYYQNSAVVMMTSEKEGFSYVLLESKAYGKPCVMYSLPYLSLVEDGKGIKAARIGDIHKMSEHLCEIMLDSKLRHQMEKEARESFENFCRYNCKDNWKKIFEDMEIPVRDENRIKGDGQECLMLNSLFDTLYTGINFRVSYALDNSYERNVGIKVLRYPRAVKRVLRFKKGNRNK